MTSKEKLALEIIEFMSSDICGEEDQELIDLTRSKLHKPELRVSWLDIYRQAEDTNSYIGNAIWHLADSFNVDDPMADRYKFKQAFFQAVGHKVNQYEAQVLVNSKQLATNIDNLLVVRE